MKEKTASSNIQQLPKIIIILFFLMSLLSGESSAQLFSSAKDDSKTGAEMDVMIKEQIGLYNETDFPNYLNQIGQKLVNKLEDPKFDFEFNVVEQIEPNAFATPGGYIYFSRGILPLANSEDDLACVLGHEIMHVIERHSAKRAEMKILPNLLSLPGKLIGAFVGEDLGNLINSPINFLNELSSSSYSRSNESEADKLGMELAAKAGYNPLNLATMLQQIEKDVEMQTGNKNKFSFFNSHPMTSDRVEDINENGTKLNWNPKEKIAEDKSFIKKFDGLCIGANPAMGIFKNKKFIHPDLGFTITFPKYWNLINIPSAVGAYTEDQDGAIFITGIGKAADPEVVGREFIKEIEDEHGVSPEKVEKTNLNSYPAYYIRIVETSGGKKSYYYYIWVTMGDLTYQLIGGGLNKYYDILDKTVYSLMPITADERKGIKVDRIRIVEAREGETIEELCQRSDNIWEPSYTAMINMLDLDTKLQEGKLIKIAKREDY